MKHRFYFILGLLFTVFLLLVTVAKFAIGNYVGGVGMGLLTLFSAMCDAAILGYVFVFEFRLGASRDEDE